MELQARIESLQRELEKANKALAFAQQYVPAELMAGVVEVSLDPRYPTITANVPDEDTFLAWANSFPVLTDLYFASTSAYPLTREEALKMTVASAAVPVHGAWKTTSQILGSRVHWQTIVGNQKLTIVLKDQASSFAQKHWWSSQGIAQTWQGVTHYALPLPKIEGLRQPVGSDEVVLANEMKEALAYLNAFLAEQAPLRRGCAPDAVLTWVLQKVFGLPFKVQSRSSPYRRQYAFGISLKGKSGAYLNIFDAKQPMIQGAEDNKLWHDIIEEMSQESASL